MAILPLGTGNDLARVLGWGKGYEDEDVEEILKDVEHSQLTMLDRWHVKVEHHRYLGLRRGGRELTMNNYLGVGCGAGVTLNFHRQRESRPSLFKSRIINKVGYPMHPLADSLMFLCRHGIWAMVLEMYWNSPARIYSRKSRQGLKNNINSDL